LTLSVVTHGKRAMWLYHRRRVWVEWQSPRELIEE
jgi:hypothetical protein